MKTRSMVSFDWAMKRLLRNKANFEVLEGFLSELVRRKIIIKSIGESESNKTDKKNKLNRVDILVESDDEELVLIELQFYNQDDYFQRMLYGVSKSVSEHLDKGNAYLKVRKIYSVNIVYFDLGEGDDYIYHGSTIFIGLHTNNELMLNEKQRQLYNTSKIGEIYPEYFIIKVSKFNDVAKDTLDEWIYYFKNNKIQDEFTAQGIDKARKILSYENLTPEEKIEHDALLEEHRNRESEILTSYTDGEFKGRAEGEAIGLEKGEAIGLEKGKSLGEYNKAVTTALKMSEDGITKDIISKYTGLSIKQIDEILKI